MDFGNIVCRTLWRIQISIFSEKSYYKSANGLEEMFLNWIGKMNTPLERQYTNYIGNFFAKFNVNE